MIAKNNYYFTLSQQYTHYLPSGELWDKDGVLQVIANDDEDVIDFITTMYEDKWSNCYTDETFDVKYFPKGVIHTINLT